MHDGIRPAVAQCNADHNSDWINGWAKRDDDDAAAHHAGPGATGKRGVRGRVSMGGR